jgi:hypothetical protein
VPDRPLVRRRTALAGLAATLLVAGCDTGEDVTPPSAEPTPSATGTTGTTDERTPDEVLVDEMLSDLGSAIGVLTAARGFRTLRKPLAPLVRAHRAHVDVLEGEVDTGTDTGTGVETPANLELALLAVHTSERALRTSLVDAAVRAESGALARLLASMSASVAQHLAALPRKALS